MSQEYDQIFDGFISSRSKIMGVAEVTRFLKPIPAGSCVLDVGCGNGLPLAKMMSQRGYRVHGVDSSKKMIAAFRENVPGSSSECASVLDCTLSGFSFSAAIAWGVLFHLSAQEQELAIAAIVGALPIGGRFLFTAGRDRGETKGAMHGVVFQYTSLGSQAYQDILRNNHCRVQEEFFDGGQNYYYVAEKVAPSSGRRD